MQTKSTSRRWPRPTPAGRRSMTWCSARCSSAAARPRSRRRSGHLAGASSTSASAPAFRLPDYSRNNRIVGVDYSEPMLRKARERVIEHKLDNVECVAVMDAKHLAFPDASFDVVVAQYVITAVPEPEATLDEFARVLKPGGEIVLVNHIGAETGLAPRVRAMVLAGGAAARLAAGVSLGAARALGGARRRAPDRAPPDAAARAFLADPVRQGGGEGADRHTRWRLISANGTCPPLVRWFDWRTSGAGSWPSRRKASARRARPR